IAKRFHTEHHEILVRATDVVDLADDVLWHLDQPIADQATIATYLVSRLASQHVKMVLTGEGGDELFAGYARYAGERFAPWTRWIPGPARTAFRHLVHAIPGPRRPKIALHALTLADEAQRHAEWFPLFNILAREELLAPEFLAQAPVRDAARVFGEQLDRCASRDPLQRMLYTDTKLWLPDYLLLRGDKLTMAHSLEARVPLLDHKLVEFAARLPSHLKLRHGVRKYLLRKVAADLLPSSVLQRKKQGFPIPLSHWLRHEARPMLHDYLAPDAVQRRGFFRPTAVAAMIRRHEQGLADHGLELWGLLSLEMWLRRFVEGSDHSTSTRVRRSPPSQVSA
ncbi:MAG TPA: asparagine synthase C-terminal domain-containing protein, partial [Pirellulaceae bacterium]